jgi:putative transposase
MTTGRKRLFHEVPPGATAHPEQEIFFVTICCKARGVNSLALPEVWSRILKAMEHFEQQGDLQVRLALAMPDHFHALWGFGGERSMRGVVAGFKRWVARHAGVGWQRDFFDHRLRSWESGVEKVAYIRNNPVRAGLVERSEDWPYQR